VTTYATAFSFIGSTKRILGWTASWRAVPVLGWVGIALVLLTAWMFVASWYALLVFAFPVVVPWRIIRRNQRRTRHLQEQQLAALRGLNR